METELELIETPYIERDGKPLMFTMVREAGRTNMPVLLEIHGGGWCAGQRETTITVMARDRAREGYLYLNLDYRLAPFHPYPAALEDLQAALDWIAQNARTYGGDPGRIGLFGFSAGGHLAVLTALTSPAPVRCAVSWGGSMDYRNPSDPEMTRGHKGTVLAFLGECYHDRPDLYRAISAPVYLSPQSPPLLIVHGQNDPVIPWHHALAMREAAQQSGAPVDVCLLPDAGHTDPGPHDPDGGRIWAYIVNALARHLQPSGPIRPLPPEPLARL